MSFVVVALNKLHPPSCIRWIENDPEAWNLILEQFGVITPPVINQRTGNLLSDPAPVTALKARYKAKQPPPPGVKPGKHGAWFLDAYALDLPQESERVVCHLLAGGLDFRLLSKLPDQLTVDVLLDLAGQQFEAVRLLGIDLDELEQILEALTISEPDRPTMKELPPDSWGIPTLDPARQLREVPTLARKWGTTARTEPMTGALIHFYTADRKFRNLIKRPERLTATGAAAAIELNFSTTPEMPPALFLFRVYQKRLLACQWQQAGVDIAVDLNVDRRFFDLNFLGVPPGWAAYANRAYSEDLEHLEEAHDRAEAHAGAPVLYVVYGGGQRVRDLCAARRWHWIPEDAARKRNLI